MASLWEYVRDLEEGLYDYNHYILILGEDLRVLDGECGNLVIPCSCVDLLSRIPDNGISLEEIAKGSPIVDEILSPRVIEVFFEYPLFPSGLIEKRNKIFFRTEAADNADYIPFPVDENSSLVAHFNETYLNS